MTTRILKPKFDRDTEEYVVRVLVDGKLDEAKTYYTDDKVDANGTYLAMVAEVAQQEF